MRAVGEVFHPPAIQAAVPRPVPQELLLRVPMLEPDHTVRRVYPGACARRRPVRGAVPARRADGRPCRRGGGVPFGGGGENP